MESYTEPDGTAPGEASALTDEEREILQRAQNLADSVLEPHAQATDRASEPPKGNLRALAEAGLLGITTPRAYGGHGVSGAFLRAFTEIMTAACGTTWFVLTQHLGACGMIAGSKNDGLKARFLRDMAAGSHMVGVAFGHLRRPEPMLRAEEALGGYTLVGIAPWVTGWPLLGGVVFGAVLPDGRFVYVYARVEESEVMHSSAPLPLCAMNATATTEVCLRGLFVPQEDVVKFSSREEMARGDTNGIASAISAPLGCARGTLKVLREAARKRKTSFLENAADDLEAEINACRTNGFTWADGPKDVPEYKPGALAARAWAIDLGVRAAHMAVTASSGGANSQGHPAQRLFREAMFYTVIAQTQDIMAATLSRLAKSR